jgi:hypothetical protein
VVYMASKVARRRACDHAPVSGLHQLQPNCTPLQLHREQPAVVALLGLRCVADSPGRFNLHRAGPGSASGVRTEGGVFR